MFRAGWICAVWLVTWSVSAATETDALRDLVYRQPKQAIAELNERLDHQLQTAEDYGLLSALLGTAYTGTRSWDEALRVVDRALLRLPEAPSEPRGELLMVRAFVMGDQGDVPGAIEIYDEVINIAELLSLKRLEAEAHTNAASLYAALDQFEPALNHIRAAHELSQGLDDLRTRALVANEMATLYAYMGQYETAVTYYQQSYELSWQQNEPIEALVSLSNLAGALRDLKRFDEAQQRYEEALRIATDQVSVEDMANILLAMADLALQQGQADIAWSHLEELSKLNFGAKDYEFQISYQVQRAEVLLQLNRPDEADSAITIATNLLRAHPDLASLWNTGYPHKVDAMVKAAKGDYDQAYRLMLTYSDDLKEHFEKRSKEHETRLRVAFDAERQKAENALLAKQNEVQRRALIQASEAQRVWSMAGAVATLAALIAVGVATVAWRARRRWIAITHTDPLTNVRNRQSFFADSSRTFENSSDERPICLLLFDVDHLRQVNNHFGYDTGDKLLAGVSRLAAGTVPHDGVVARIGGGEFAVLLADTELDQAAAVAQRLRSVIEQADFIAVAAGLQVTASFGVVRRQRGDTIEALIGRAEVLLLAARAAGRNRVEIEE